MSAKQAHLEMIQGVINRLSHSSFLLKGWTVILVSAMFALGARGNNQYFFYLAFFPALVFWFLDGYFLWQERLFRKLYDNVRVVDESNIDYSMDVTTMKNSVSSLAKVISSGTLLVFHGVIVLTIVVVMLIAT